MSIKWLRPMTQKVRKTETRGMYCIIYLLIRGIRLRRRFIRIIDCILMNVFTLKLRLFAHDYSIILVNGEYQLNMYIYLHTRANRAFKYIYTKNTFADTWVTIFINVEIRKQKYLYSLSAIYSANYCSNLV